MPVKRYNGTTWDVVAGDGATGPSGAAPLTTKGDLLGFDTAANRVAVGTNGQVLTADSTTSAGVAWAAGSGMTLIQTITMTQASNSAASFTSIPSTYKHLFFTFSGWNPATNDIYLNGRLNNDAGSNYTSQCLNVTAGTTTVVISSAEMTTFMNPAASGSGICTGGNSTGANWQAHSNSSLWIYNYKDTTNNPTYEWRSHGYSGGQHTYVTGFGVYKASSTAVSRVDFSSSSGNANCTIKLWGVN